MNTSALRTTATLPAIAIALSLTLGACQSQGTDKPSVTDPSGSDVGNPMAAMPEGTSGNGAEPSMPGTVDTSDGGTSDGTDGEPDGETDGAPKDETPPAQPDLDTIEPTIEPVACGELDPADRAALLERMNDARAEARRCGADTYAAAPALVWDSRLEAAANVHSNDMASNDFFSHTGSDGSAHSDRTDRAGYAWSRVGENIAAGQRDADVAIQGWLDSPGHCRNLMSPGYRAVGMACVQSASSRYGNYWTQVFAAPR